MGTDPRKQSYLKDKSLSFKNTLDFGYINTSQRF